MAAELVARFPAATVELIASGGGRFEVACNGRLVFEKSRLKRHPAAGEIIELLVPLATLT